MARALIVVDVQVDFCEGGALGVEGGNAVAEAIADLLGTDHEYDYVVATRDHHIDPGDHFSDEPDYVDSWPPHCVVGTAGQELHPALADTAFDAIFDKGSFEAAYSGFEGTVGGSDDGVSLSDWLADREVEEVDVCGIATDYCVRATALDAQADEYDTVVLAELTAAVHPDNLDAVRDDLLDAGVAWQV
ncbi:isochorismatase family protein [Tessaracoccus caeni]|uniref:isochorismatase family protein n=1 Tax=Tessaracoccus caeni TaxID=3031239 RepID=UPI0023DB62E6|nr:isochorismatase family protein [Tessaracoccus caeni]MDF1487632.1 isochorismatase family protein [Tessaracoccus caeni]